VTLVIPLAACGGQADMGDLPTQVAIDKCLQTAEKARSGKAVEAAAIKADRY
jgi:hypothetical protein